MVVGGGKGEGEEAVHESMEEGGEEEVGRRKGGLQAVVGRFGLDFEPCGAL